MPFESAVRAVHVTGTEEINGDQGRWFTRWRIELDSGDLELPTTTGARRSSERAAAEDFALEVLNRLRHVSS